MLKVSTNGFISFGGEITTDPFNVRPFSSRTLNFPMIAPLWADFNFREDGTIYFRATNKSDILKDASERIARHDSNYTGYVPREAVIVTWFQSRVFEGTFEVSQRVQSSAYSGTPK